MTCTRLHEPGDAPPADGPRDPVPRRTSDWANTGALCTTCHQLKTDGRVTITDGRADGSATWSTAWGQRVTIPPRRFLLGSDPDDPPERPATPLPEPPDPPPF